MIDDDLKKKVWQKATPINGENPDECRKDCLGNTIKYEHYGDRNKKTGWEIDHKTPSSKGGADDLKNLQPLQYKANIKKGDKKDK